MECALYSGRTVSINMKSFCESHSVTSQCHYSQHCRFYSALCQHSTITVQFSDIPSVCFFSFPLLIPTYTICNVKWRTKYQKISQGNIVMLQKSMLKSTSVVLLTMLPNTKVTLFADMFYSRISFPVECW